MTTSKIMFDKEERKERMQMNLEASNACLVTKASSFSSGEVRNSMVFPGINCDNIRADLGISDQSITGEASGAIYLGYSTPVYHQDVLMWPGFYSNALMQHNHMNGFNSHFYLPNQEYVYPVENRNQLPLKMVTHNYPLEGQFQEFQYFVVIDFEATCDKDKSPDPQEIIEFPSVLVNSMTGELEASFQTYVRPTYHTALSDFCKQLTGIQQIQVDRGVSLSEALLMHDKWLEEKGIKHKNFAIVTWSNWDCHVMLESECKLKRIRKPPYFNRWINLKVPFQQVFGDVRCNLKGAIQLAGLTWEGRAHCGLDDARNTARLLVLLMCWGFPFTITNSLACHALECTSNSLKHRVGSPQPFGKPKGVTGADLQFQLTRYCFCGVKCSKCVVRKPGPTQGRWFFGCGNWTASRQAACNYFVWAS